MQAEHVVVVLDNFEHLWKEDNINILVLPADFVSACEGQQILSVWLSAQFKQGRYAQRLAMIDEIAH